MTRNAEPMFSYRAVIAAPTGELMLWTEANDARAAKRKLLRKLAGKDSFIRSLMEPWWRYAESQGYRLKWTKDFVRDRR